MEMMKKILMMAILCLVFTTSGFAQFKRTAFNHVGLNAGVGTEGISIGVAAPISNFVELEAGVDILPKFLSISDKANITTDASIIVQGQTVRIPDSEVDIDADKMPADREGCDIGPKTQALFADAVKTAKTVVWNGPMGVFENPTLAAGTIAVAKSLAETSATTIIGGGDSAAAVNTLGFGDKMTHISTGGGASLEFLEGKALPGIESADDK